MKPLSPYQYRIALVHDGYAVVDEDGPVEAERYRTWTAAAARLTEMELEDIEASATGAAAMSPPTPLRAALEASVHHPDEIELFGRLQDIATVLSASAETIRLGALRGEPPSLETLIGIVTAIHVADAAALAYANSRGIFIKSAADPC